MLFVIIALSMAFPQHACASATCSDGSAPNANGCCSDNECPPCCLTKATSSSGSGDTTCTCSACEGTAVQFDEMCASDCSGYFQARGENHVASLTMMGCSQCMGSETACFYPRDACESLMTVASAAQGGSTISLANDVISCRAANTNSARSMDQFFFIKGLIVLVWLLAL